VLWSVRGPSRFLFFFAVQFCELWGGKMGGGIENRTPNYKQEIAAAKPLDSKKDHVPLMEWLDIRKLQMEKQLGTSQGNMSILTAFGQRGKEQKKDI
jgi:hypothetical protein